MPRLPLHAVIRDVLALHNSHGSLPTTRSDKPLSLMTKLLWKHTALPQSCPQTSMDNLQSLGIPDFATEHTSTLADDDSSYALSNLSVGDAERSVIPPQIVTVGSEPTATSRHQDSLYLPLKDTGTVNLHQFSSSFHTHISAQTTVANMCQVMLIPLKANRVIDLIRKICHALKL
jgi:hypothetical protein